jgi:hypothetical protein
MVKIVCFAKDFSASAMPSLSPTRGKGVGKTSLEMTEERFRLTQKN